MTPTNALTPTAFLPLIVRNYPDPLTRLGNGGYEDLATHLRALPEIADGISGAEWDALDDIADLGLAATNPEVREALDLMVSGGVPSAADYEYPVPHWNVQLQVLLRTAKELSFDRNDEMVIANSAVNGLWIAMGDVDVDARVFEDSVRVIEIFRAHPRYERIRDYPYRALLALFWRGTDWDSSPDRGPHQMGLYNYRQAPLDLDGYEWNFISPAVLEDLILNPIIPGLGGLDDPNEVVDLIENHFMIGGPNWVWGSYDEFIMINGRMTRTRNYSNPDFAVAYVRENGVGLGVCGDQAHLFHAVCKSKGIPVLTFYRKWLNPDGTFNDGHGNVLYYDPVVDSWKIHRTQWEMGTPRQMVMIVKPPTVLPGWSAWVDPFPFGSGQYWTWNADATKEQVQETFGPGLPNDQLEIY